MMQGKEESTPLIAACHSGKKELVELYINYNVDIDKKTEVCHNITHILRTCVCSHEGT